MLDLGFLRGQFPGLDGEWTHFENAGGSQILGRVADLVRDYLLNTNVQTGAPYELSRTAGERVTEGAEAIADLLNAADPTEVIFGHSTSQNLKILAEALASQFKEGDEIVLTNVEHEANVTPWLPLKERGVKIRFWEVDRDSMALRLEDLKTLLNERTKLVAFGQVSNILGSLMPVAEITKMVHDAGARVVVDGVAYAPHRSIDVRAWDVDYYAVSLYKVFGPHIGALYGKRALLEELDVVNHYFIRKNDVPYKFQLGSVPYELAASCVGITDYLVELGAGSIAKAFDEIAEHEEALSKRLLDFLNAQGGVRVIGDTCPDRKCRVPTISFATEGRKPRELAEALGKEKIATRNGHFYAARLLESLGLDDGILRVSMVHYNTIEEVDLLIRTLEPMLTA